MADDKKKAKVKKPSALKRDIQGEKRRLQNKTYRSAVSSAIKSFQASVSQNDATMIKEKFSQVCGLMDKGVKKGIFPRNKANRTKSSLSSKVPA